MVFAGLKKKSERKGETGFVFYLVLGCDVFMLLSMPVDFSSIMKLMCWYLRVLRPCGHRIRLVFACRAMLYSPGMFLICIYLLAGMYLVCSVF